MDFYSNQYFYLKQESEKELSCSLWDWSIPWCNWQSFHGLGEPGQALHTLLHPLNQSILSHGHVTGGQLFSSHWSLPPSNTAHSLRFSKIIAEKSPWQQCEGNTTMHAVFNLMRVAHKVSDHRPSSQIAVGSCCDPLISSAPNNGLQINI